LFIHFEYLRVIPVPASVRVGILGNVSVIQTVTGPVEPSELGVTLVHEHVFIDMYEPTLNSAGVLLDEAIAADELERYRAAGGTTLVDQTTLGLHPDLPALRRASLATGVRIVAGTGLYWRRFRPAWVEPLSESELADRFVADLEEGIGDERIRAGIIGEVASGHREIDEIEARAFRAAARASQRTGAAVATHAIFTPIGLAQLDILEAAGADPARVVVGHADTCADPAYHAAILRRGAWLAFDTVGQTDKTSDAWRADRLAELAAEGHLDRLLISSDVCKRPALVAFGGGGYAHVLDSFVPLLRARGFGDPEIERLLVLNPRAMLAGEQAPDQPRTDPDRNPDTR
jgi:predicted metal-dependent phosphotriesterase family hydrolase